MIVLCRETQYASQLCLRVLQVEHEGESTHIDIIDIIVKLKPSLEETEREDVMLTRFLYFFYNFLYSLAFNLPSCRYRSGMACLKVYRYELRFQKKLMCKMSILLVI